MIPIDWKQGGEILLPLMVFVIGMVAYSVFIFKFYRFAARKNVISVDLSRYNFANHPFIIKFVDIILYLFKYIFLFPVFTAFWFAVLTVFISFLSKTQDLSTLLLVSMAVVSAVRVTSYYDEDLSKDLAKLLPFALLGVFVIDIQYSEVDTTMQLLTQAPGEMLIIGWYLAFAIALEFVLRLTETIVRLFMNE